MSKVRYNKLLEGLTQYTDKDAEIINKVTESENYEAVSDKIGQLAHKYSQTASALFGDYDDLVQTLWLIIFNILVYDEDDYAIDSDPDKRRDYKERVARGELDYFGYSDLSLDKNAKTRIGRHNWINLMSLDDLTPNGWYKILENYLLDVLRSNDRGDTNAFLDQEKISVRDEDDYVDIGGSEDRKSTQGYSQLEVEELAQNILNLFSPKSKERKYLVIKMVESGVIDLEDLSEVDQDLYEVPESDDELDILKLLGYKVDKTGSGGPGSWKGIKYDMYERISWYLKDHGFDINIEDLI